MHAKTVGQLIAFLEDFDKDQKIEIANFDGNDCIEIFEKDSNVIEKVIIID